MHSPIAIRAGQRALERIRAHGLDAADVEIDSRRGRRRRRASGIAGLDRAIFGEWLPSAPRVRHLVGASIGAWRFAAACCNDPARRARGVRARLLRADLSAEPSRALRLASRRARCCASLFAGREDEILASPGYRLHILAVRGRWPLTRDSRFDTPLGFGMAAMANVIGRRHLARFIERTVFHDARDARPSSRRERFDAFHTHTVPLDAANLGEALLASASIPIVLEGVADIPDAPTGTYWDGGIIDYHLHLPYHRARDSCSIRTSPTASFRAGSTSRCRGGARAAHGSTTSCWSPLRANTSRHCRTQSCPTAGDFKRFATTTTGG